ncbi:MAG: rod shape-determining protein MreD [Bacteroidota bacterium]|nr:rod shape-determining protein MreD [Bacteroidota bacterium]MDP4230356.1 rod shape-determining protein MreD [Bacteroidota bacterium]
MPYLIESAIALLLVIVQVLASRFISSFTGATPDLALIFLVYIIITRGQLVAELSGFVLGLALDILSSGSLGAHALSYTLAGFLLGYFFNEEVAKQRLRNWPFLLFVFAASLIANLIYYFFFTAGSGLSFIAYATEHGGLTVLYTVVAAIVPMYYWSRRPLY